MIAYVLQLYLAAYLCQSITTLGVTRRV